MFFPTLISLYGPKTCQTAFKITLFQELNRCWCKNIERQDWISECEKDRDEWRRWGSKKFFSLMGGQNHFSVMSPLTLDGSLCQTHEHTCYGGTAVNFVEPSELLKQFSGTVSTDRGRSKVKKINHDDFLITGPCHHLIKGIVWLQVVHTIPLEWKFCQSQFLIVGLIISRSTPRQKSYILSLTAPVCWGPPLIF